MLSFKEILSASLILFAVIDILGSIPIVIELRTKYDKIQSGKASLAAAAVMLIFLFAGERLLALFGLDVASFAIAGSIVIFVIAMEMILGVTIMKADPSSSTGTIFPLAFPMLAGAGTLTTLLSIRSEFEVQNIVIAIVINIIVVYAILKVVPYLHRKLGNGGVDILRRIFGVILLSIAVKMFKTNVFGG